MRLRRERGRRQFKTNLIIPLSSCPVRDGIRRLRARDLDYSLRNQGTGDAGPEKILSFVSRARLKYGKNKITSEFFAQISMMHFIVPARRAFSSRPSSSSSCPIIGAEGDNLCVVVVPKPAKNYRSAEPAGIRENNLHLRTRR